MAQFIAVVFVQALLVFWAWMFWDMSKNQGLPDCFLTLTSNGNPRLDWNFAFIFLNVITAVYYYASVYRHRR